MAKKDNKRTGGQLLVDSLLANGVEQAFCVPGESYLAVLDAFYDAAEIDLVVCRQEGGAAIMAEAHGKLTGRPGICFVTRAPGATNASAGVHIAYQDSTPMILFIGQVVRDMRDREAFQEIDFRRMFGEMTKWTAEIDAAARVPEYVSHAFHLATSGRPGPVALALPEDMLNDLATPSPIAPAVIVQAHPGGKEMARLRELLANAERPLAILGGGGWDADACHHIQRFVEANDLPVTCSFRCQDLFDNEHANYAGDVGIGINPKLGSRFWDADLLLAIGPRLGEISTSGYTLIDIPVPKQPLVHVHPGAEELGRVYRPEIAINAGMRAFAEAAAAMEPVGGDWRDWTQSAREDYLAWNEPAPIPGDLQLGEVVKWLRENLPADSIVCNGAGNYSTWVHRFFRYRGFRTQLGPTSGSMGYGVPAAISAKRFYPDRTVVAFAGDGCFLMTGQELATAIQYNINIVIIIVNNAMYGTIRMHQERHYPGRVSGTNLVNPDFADLARAYGAHGETVTRTEDFAPAFERAETSDKPAVIELRIDPEAITPSATLSGIRDTAKSKA